MRIAVFQRGKRGEHKIRGIKKYGTGMEVEVYNVPEDLPEIVDNPEDFLPEDIEAELILDYVYHDDITDYLVDLGRKKGIPVIASGRKIRGAITPATCCALGEVRGIEGYTSIFGSPELEVEVEGGVIKRVDVKRGAPCGATWEAAKKIVGMRVEEAPARFALEVQFICSARGFYHWAKKAPLHVAGELHKEAIKRAISR